MTKPILVVMAAGIGSRYGGLKQIDPVGSNGELIIDFSIYDAIAAGFEKVIFIIKRSIEADFKEIIGNRVASYIHVEYAYQEVNFLPKGFEKPAERTKPWGTAHAVLSAKELIDGPFVVINADDYYGTNAFSQIYNYLYEHSNDEKRFAMVGYKLINTVTEHGHVARGICEVSNDSRLVNITERTHIEVKDDEIMYTEDNVDWISLSEDTIVSMNLWGFTPTVLDEIEKEFTTFLNQNLLVNPLKCEYFLPSVVDNMIKSQMASVEVLETSDKWYGVTYKDDKPIIVKALKDLKSKGVYPDVLWN